MNTVMARRKQRTDLDDFLDAYVEAALWSSNDESDDSGGEPLDKNYGPNDLADSTKVAMQKDCASFLERFGKLLEDDDSPEIEKWGRMEMAGHDFWLSRNGHGAGFFDGAWPKHGDELQDAAESYGNFDLYVGDDKEIYAMGHENDAGGVANEHRDTRTGKFAPGPGPRKHGGESVVRGPYEASRLPNGQWRLVYKRSGGGHGIEVLGNYPNEEAAMAAADEHQRSRGHVASANRRRGRALPPKQASGYGYPRSPSDQYILTRDGKEVARGTEQQVWAWMHSNLGYSVEHALHHEGYKMTPVEQAGGAHEPQQVHDYEATDHRGRKIAGPFKHYDQAKTAADRAGGTVQFVVGECGARHRTVPGMQATGRRHRGHQRYAAGEAARRAAPARRSGPVTAFAIATELSRRAKGTTPNRIPGGHRWTDRNESTHFTTYSPEHSQRVVVLVSVFENDNHIALDFFADDSLSETARYENIGNFLYRGPDYGEMMADLKWVWETVDSYADSWGAGQDDVDESRRGRMAERKPNDVAVTVYFSGSKEQSSRTAMSIADVIEHATGTKLHWRVSPFQGQWAAQYQYIGRDQYRKVEGAIYAKFGNAVRVTQTALREGTTASEGHNMHSMNAARRRPRSRRGAPRRNTATGRPQQFGSVHVTSKNRPDLNGSWSFRVQPYPDGDGWEWVATQNGGEAKGGGGRTKAEAVEGGRGYIQHIQKIAKKSPPLPWAGAGGPPRLEAPQRTVASTRRHDRSVLSRHDAKRMAEEARGQKRRLREGPDAEEAGERYAEDQINGDFFTDWVWDQMIEGRRMRKADPKSVIPLESAADYKRLARNMLQQLGWDIDRGMSMRDVLDAVGVDDQGSAANSEVARDFAKGVNTILHKPSVVQWLASECRRIEKELKQQERHGMSGHRKRVNEAPQTTRLLPPAPHHR